MPLPRRNKPSATGPGENAMPFQTQNPPQDVEMPLDTMVGHTPQPKDPATVRPRAGLRPIGQSGRANFYGLPQWDELNPKLVGPRGCMVLDDIYRTDAHVRRLVLAAWAPLVAGTWTLEPYGGEDATDQDRQIADTIWWGLSEWMSPNFQEHLYELGPVLLRTGFAPFEQLWDTCTHRGKTLTLPKSLQLRLPRTIWRWWQDDFGALTHIGQILPNRADVVIPASELVYYRLGAEGDNWMGTSLLRHCYKNWYLKDKLETLDAIGQERKAVGMPVLYHSPDTPEDQLNAIEQALASMHISEVAYFMLPGWKMGQAPQDAGAAAQYLVDVIQFDSSAGSGIRESIEYHQTAISASFLTDFLELGHHQVGARATAEVQEDPFLTAVNGALLPPVIPPLNRLVDRIRQLNWPQAEGSPTLKLTIHDEASLSEIATYVQQLVGSGALNVDNDLEDWLRERGGLPVANADARDVREQQEQLEQQASMAQSQAKAQDPQGLNQVAAKASVAPPAAQPGKQAAGKPPAAQSAPPAKPAATPAPKPAKKLEAAGLKGAGIVMHAKDTGRVLMVQRKTDAADDDESRGKWEFGGGKLEDGETPFGGARREWQEETGAKIPAGAKSLGTLTSKDGVYRHFVIQVPREAEVGFGDHDPKEIADVGWKDPADLQADDTVRGKVRKQIPAIRGILGAKQLDTGSANPSDPADRRIAVDFDGVIREHNSGELVRDPITHTTARDILPKLAKEYEIVIFTANDNHDDIRQFLEANGLGQFVGSVTSEKPTATAYIDDNGIQFTTWDAVPDEVVQQARRGRNPAQAKNLDAPSPPPNLRLATDSENIGPEHECGTCKMFDLASGTCWGYGNIPVKGEWTCDSWTLSGNWKSQDQVQDTLDSVPRPAQLDGSLGSVGGESGLQMVPETGDGPKCTCDDDDDDGDCPV